VHFLSDGAKSRCRDGNTPTTKNILLWRILTGARRGPCMQTQRTVDKLPVIQFSGFHSQVHSTSVGATETAGICIVVDQPGLWYSHLRRSEGIHRHRVPVANRGRRGTFERRKCQAEREGSRNADIISGEHGYRSRVVTATSDRHRRRLVITHRRNRCHEATSKLSSVKNSQSSFFKFSIEQP
jgi:hypothetical protein